MSYFSIPFEFVMVGSKIGFDLYVNSSTHDVREHFVRIFPAGQVLTVSDLTIFRQKYYQLYVSETQRDSYLASLSSNTNLTETKKTEVIKESAIKYLSTLFDAKKQFTTELLHDTISGCRESIESMVHVIKGKDISDVQKLIGDLSFHDFYTYDHSINVAMYSMALFQAAKGNASKSEIVTAGLGGLLHDLGKLKISTKIINNPDKLTDQDFSIIKKHPSYGKELFQQNGIVMSGIDLSIIERIIYEHHENFNGTGYPNQIVGENIHLMARVTAIADFFDAITTKRSYHEVLSTEDALAIMANSASKKIDPELFTLFTSRVKNLVLNGKNHFCVKDDFDPCQPHRVLPVEKVPPNKQEHKLFEKENNFGSVKSDIDQNKKKAA
ncbi:MAG: HD domain-containing protein [Bdellovibrio sp.]|nr:HD domain-containing protein [Bdellovibrio sp.]